jgi:DNA/RNA-binding domain of Phe-tRNA-synthetase-like protein
VSLAIGVAADLVGRVRLGALTFVGLSVRTDDAALGAALDSCCAEMKASYGGRPSSEVPGAAEARTLYKALGIDPTKTRPSNEALLRRALKGEGFYRINSLVDAVNLCSLRDQLPYGLYDLSRLAPPVELRRGREGEGYEGIRKGVVNVSGRPVLVDGLGPFGNPTSDSARSMITEATQTALLTVYAPAGYNLMRLERVLDGAAATVTRFCRGSVVERQVVGEAADVSRDEGS